MKINFKNFNWQTLLGAVKDPIGLLSPSFELQAFTNAFSEIYLAIANKSPEVNDAILDFFPNEKRPELMALFNQARQDHFSLTDTLVIKNRRIEARFIFLPFTESDQKIAGYILVVQTLHPTDDLNEAKRSFINENQTAANMLRQEIGRELHDNVNQLLSAAHISIDTVYKDMQKNDGLLRRSISLLTSAVQEIRVLSGELIRPSSGVSELRRAIEQLVEDITRGSDVNIHVEYAGFSETGWKAEYKTNVFRIIQEQLNNILKHSGATKVLLSLSQKEGEVRLIISDNGKGFDPAADRVGIGLYSISHRVQSCKGTMKLLTKPGEGCTIDIQFTI